MLDCDGHLYMEPDVMADIVGPAGSSWIIDYLRTFVGSEQDLAMRAKAHEDVWSVNVEAEYHETSSERGASSGTGREAPLPPHGAK